MTSLREIRFVVRHGWRYERNAVYAGLAVAVAMLALGLMTAFKL